MSAPAEILYSNSQTVVVQNEPATPISTTLPVPTSYLLNQAGHTTAVLVQTDQPANGVTLPPLLYTARIQTALPSITASVLPLRWAYKGCFNDVYPTGRVLPLKQASSMNLTVQACVWSCYKLGYSISGLEFGKQCFCGNAIYYGGALSQWDFDCSWSCTGNKSEVCGGQNKLSIYSNRTLKTYPSEVALTTELAATVPTTAPSFPISTSRTQVPTIGTAVIGALTGIAIMIALLFYLRRRLQTTNLWKESHKRPVQLAPYTWRSNGRIASCKDFAKQDEEDLAGFGESTLALSEDNNFISGLESTKIGYRSSVSELKDRYEQLYRNNPQWANTGWKSSDNYLASPTTESPPPLQAAPAQARPAHLTSILKHPMPTRTAKRTRSLSKPDDERGLEDVSSKKNLATAKNGVRFGVDQIREFGRSPVIGH